MRGSRKLPLHEVLQRASKEEVVLFLPPLEKGSPPEWAAAHNEVMSHQMRRIIMLVQSHKYFPVELGCAECSSFKEAY
jgi:hypothetical protein